MNFNVMSYRVSKLFFFTKHVFYQIDNRRQGFFSMDLEKFDFIDTQRNYKLEICIEQRNAVFPLSLNSLPYRFVLKFQKNNSIFKTVVKSKYFGIDDENVEIFNNAFKKLLKKVKYDINNLPTEVKK